MLSSCHSEKMLQNLSVQLRGKLGVRTLSCTMPVSRELQRHCRGCIPCQETLQGESTMSRDTAEGVYRVKRHCRGCLPCQETLQRVHTVSRDTAEGAYCVKRHCRGCLPCFSCVMVRSCSTLLSQGSEAVRPARAACSFRCATTEVQSCSRKWWRIPSIEM